MSEILIYGGYGYTGTLIIDECLRNGLRPKIAGRNKEKIQALAGEKGLEWEAFAITEKDKLNGWLQSGKVVIHCAGPFIHTSREMVEACLNTNTHYLDITGEYQVFDLVQSYSEQAKEKEIMLLPGAGFDVVPSDCLSAHLHKLLPDANELELAFVAKGGRLSRGTAKTMIESFGDPQVRRANGNYEFANMGKRVKTINYGPFEQLSMAISWGDISTAFFSTGIPNIEVYSGTTEKQLGQVKKMNLLSFLLKSRVVKNFLKKQIDKKPPGPSDDRRKEANMYLWGKLTNGTKTVEARLATPNGYTLTAGASVLIAKKILDGNYKSGYQTPSTAYGEGLILEINDCKLT
ncbi:MAG: saccharopine dehydrogenase NADP-binding domain-containing protein [Cyclobacteriaceae bacterium]